MIFLLVSVAVSGGVVGFLVGALGLIMVRMAAPSPADEVAVSRPIALVESGRGAA